MKDEEELAHAQRPTSATTSSTKRTEFDFINLIRQRALSRNRSSEKSTPSSLVLHPSSLMVGIGDDAAIIRESAGRNTLITTDLLIEDIAIPPRRAS